MFLSRIFGRSDVRPTRPITGRRPMLEDLEGRKLLSTVDVGDVSLRKHFTDAIQGNHIGTNVADVQGGHIGSKT